MAGDFLLADGITLGEWIHARFHRDVTFERDGWGVERVQRVADRLQAGRSQFNRLTVEVPWIQMCTAFTLPGRYVYVSRRLLELCPDDESTALLIAHEIAHHDLGHMTHFPHWLGRFVHRRAGLGIVLAMAGIEKRLYGPERECDADREGLRLCLQAGYDPQKCLYLFHLLEVMALNMGDDDIVFGPDSESDEELSPEAPLMTKIRIWTWQRTRGYLPIRDRLAALVHYLGSEASGKK